MWLSHACSIAQGPTETGLRRPSPCLADSAAQAHHPPKVINVLRQGGMRRLEVSLKIGVQTIGGQENRSGNRDSVVALPALRANVGPSFLPSLLLGCKKRVSKIDGLHRSVVVVSLLLLLPANTVTFQLDGDGKGSCDSCHL